MQQSSDNIGAIAAALARAQANLANPEKTQTAVIHSPFPREGSQTFRYASLASGLEIVRKALSQEEIATIQTTRVDQVTGRIHLATTLAHSSGEWISSDWPVVSGTELDAPHRMGMALTYARRYSLFALVGIAGEDDLDAPDLVRGSPSVAGPVGLSRNTAGAKIAAKPAALSTHESAALRDQLLTEILAKQTEDELLRWVNEGLVRKNTLLDPDARAVEIAYRQRLDEISLTNLSVQSVYADETAKDPDAQPDPDPAALAFPKEPVRRRSKAHLQFVREQPCLICKRLPSDPHHLKFAQPRALGRKVSDEYTVPLCRAHHDELHRHGNEKSWWINLQIEPTAVASELWRTSPIQKHSATTNGRLSGP